MGEIFFPPISGDPWCYSPDPSSGVPSVARPAHSLGGCNPNDKQYRSAYPILCKLDVYFFIRLLQLDMYRCNIRSKFRADDGVAVIR